MKIIYNKQSEIALQRAIQHRLERILWDVESDPNVELNSPFHNRLADLSESELSESDVLESDSDEWSTVDEDSDADSWATINEDAICEQIDSVTANRTDEFPFEMDFSFHETTPTRSECQLSLYNSITYDNDCEASKLLIAMNVFNLEKLKDLYAKLFTLNYETFPFRKEVMAYITSQRISRYIEDADYNSFGLEFDINPYCTLAIGFDLSQNSCFAAIRLKPSRRTAILTDGVIESLFAIQKVSCFFIKYILPAQLATSKTYTFLFEYEHRLDPMPYTHMSFAISDFAIRYGDRMMESKSKVGVCQQVFFLSKLKISCRKALFPITIREVDRTASNNA